MPRTKPDLSWTRINIDAPELFPIHDVIPAQVLTEGYQMIAHDLIELSPDRLRESITPESVEELQAQILDARATGGGLEKSGIEEPLTVRPNLKREGYYLIVTGNRRWTATEGTAVKELPCIVRHMTRAGEALEVELATAIHHASHTPIEEGRGLIRFMAGVNKDGAKLSIRDTAARMGKTKGWIENRIALAKAKDDVQQLASLRKDTVMHAQEINKVDDTRQRRQLINATLHGATYPAIKQQVDTILGKPPKEPPKAAPLPSTPSAPPQLTIVPEVLPAADLQSALFHVERAARELGKLHKPQEYYRRELKKQVAALRAQLDEIERVGVGKAVEAAA